MRRLAIIVVAAAFLALGTGALSWLHNLDHAARDAAHAAAKSSNCKHHHHETPVPPHHNADNCELHSLLNASLISASAVPALILLGLFVAFLSQLSSVLIPQRIPSRLSCRGPPFC